jgi:hypothetical protein
MPRRPCLPARGRPASPPRRGWNRAPRSVRKLRRAFSARHPLYQQSIRDHHRDRTGRMWVSGAGRSVDLPHDTRPTHLQARVLLAWRWGGDLLQPRARRRSWHIGHKGASANEMKGRRWSAPPLRRPIRRWRRRLRARLERTAGLDWNAPCGCAYRTLAASEREGDGHHAWAVSLL